MAGTPPAEVDVTVGLVRRLLQACFATIFLAHGDDEPLVRRIGEHTLREVLAGD